MKTAMKKLFSLLLVAVLLVGVLPFQAFAEEVAPAAEDAAGIPEEQGIVDYIPCQVCLWLKWDMTFDHHDWDHCAECYKLNGHSEDCSKWTCGTCGKNPCVCNAPVTPPAPPAPTTLTVKFYVDGTVAQENANVTAAATVQALINQYCTVDDTVTLNYDGAKVNGNSVELSTVINLGETVDVYLSTVTPPTQPTPPAETTPPTQPAPAACSVCGANVLNGMCTGCSLEECDCTCNQTPSTESHWGEIMVTPKFRNDQGMFYDGEPVYVKMGSTMRDAFAKIAIPAGYRFDFWSWDMWGKEPVGQFELVPAARNVVIFAQYAKDVQVEKGFDIHVNLNYDWKMGETLKDVAFGTLMHDALKHISDPVRWGYKFDGWYWDAACTDAVQWNDPVLMHCVIYAKWVPFQTETMLKIYVNGNAVSVAKIVDLYDYAKDGWITMDEVKAVVNKYYTAKNSNGLSFAGLYDDHNWHSYVYNHRHPGANSIPVNKLADTTVYVMVGNAQVRSTAAADTTNPKTGDMIMMPAAVLGLSASALAVLFYLNKKRAV